MAALPQGLRTKIHGKAASFGIAAFSLPSAIGRSREHRRLLTVYSSISTEN
jgi:hypothetical protein